MSTVAAAAAAVLHAYVCARVRTDESRMTRESSNTNPRTLIRRAKDYVVVEYCWKLREEGGNLNLIDLLLLSRIALFPFFAATGELFSS